MRNLATIQEIVDIKPIDGADSINVATILGWQCVVAKKDNFEIGDKIIYIEVDSIVPEKPEFEFLRSRKFRIKTIKLRGQISQGLVLPLTVLTNSKEYKIGDDVTDVLGIKKHDPEAELEQNILDNNNNIINNKINKYFSKYSWYRRLFFTPKKSSFPNFIKKTDENRLQNIPNIIHTEKDTDFMVTEKIEGQSATYYLLKNPKQWQFWNKYIFGVCSRNLELPKEDNSSYWTIARQYNIKNVLHNLIGEEKFIVLQGEIIGDKIQKNIYKINGYDFYAFNLIYPNNKIDTVIMEAILSAHNIKTVPSLAYDFNLKPTIQENIDYSKGMSKIYPTLREGVVLRNYNKNISFKIINPEYLLKNND
jgi:hypothetical protein